MELKFTDEILQLDKQNMIGVLEEFPQQMEKAGQIGKECDIFRDTSKIEKILILGMGGSAIGGDLLRSYLANIDGASHLQIIVNRDYDIPGFIDENTYVIGSSYSGNTEETLSAFRKAEEKTKHLMALTSGGRLEEFCKSQNIPVAHMPPGYQPRAALGYSFIILLQIILRSGAVSSKAKSDIEKSLNDAVALVKENEARYKEFSDENPALKLASELHGKIPVIYSSSDVLDIVNLRWRGQFQENSKNMAFGSLLPEMNHNEINGWLLPEDALDKFRVILLTDPQDHERNKLRFKALRNILERKGLEVSEFSGEGNNLLTRIFGLIYLSDWASVYLGLMNGQDPTDIPVITELKEELSGK